MRATTADLRREAGFTVVEVVIAASILVVVIAVAVASLVLTQRSMNEGLVRSRVQENVSRVLQTIVPELRQSGAIARGSGVAVSANSTGDASKKLVFRKNTGFDGTNNTWTGDIAYEWRRDGTVARTDPGGSTAVVGGGIDADLAFGIVALGANDAVSISIASTIELSDGNSVRYSVTETAVLRN